MDKLLSQDQFKNKPMRYHVSNDIYSWTHKLCIWKHQDRTTDKGYNGHVYPESINPIRVIIIIIQIFVFSQWFLLFRRRLCWIPPNSLKGLKVVHAQAIMEFMWQVWVTYNEINAKCHPDVIWKNQVKIAPPLIDVKSRGPYDRVNYWLLQYFTSLPCLAKP